MPDRDLTLTLVGGPTLLIEVAGLRLLTDPTFDKPGDYAAGPVTLRKLTAPVLSPGDIGEIDAVLLSHDQHFDNFDRAGREFAATAAKTFITPAGAGRLGGNAVGLAPWQTAELPAAGGSRVYVSATPCRHGPAGIEPISGEVTGFALGIDAPGDLAYITGDTVWFEGVAEVARRFHPRLLIAFAGSAETARGRFHLTMDSNDVIEAAHAFPEARIIAIHNEGWEHFKESAADLAQAMSVLGVGDRLMPIEKGKPLRVRL